MPKRDISHDATIDTTYQIILDGLMSSIKSIKPPKRVSLSGHTPNWRMVAEKKQGVTDGVVISKNATPGTPKHEHLWMYKRCLDDSDHEKLSRYFRSHFNETVASELFRYALGERAPKNRLAKNEKECPGLLSRFLPEFRSFNAVIVGVTDADKASNLSRLSDINGFADMVVVSAFFNDHDARFENCGLFRSVDGGEKVGRIDFGAAFAQLNHPIFCLGIYLFGQGEYDPRLKKYAHRYGWLLKTEALQTSLQKMAALNITHLSALVEVSVHRWVDTWVDSLVPALAIQKLFKHLFGKDRSLWERHGYQEQPSIAIDFTRFKQTITETLIHSFVKRQRIFSFLAKLLSLVNATLFSPDAFESLVQESREDTDKMELLKWVSESQYFCVLPLLVVDSQQEPGVCHP